MTARNSRWFSVIPDVKACLTQFHVPLSLPIAPTGHSGQFKYVAPPNALGWRPQTTLLGQGPRFGEAHRPFPLEMPIIACFGRFLGCLRLQAVPVGPCSRIKGTGRSIALGLRPLTTHFSVWAREGGRISPNVREKASILHGELEELE
jgi:hypothetical protein